MEESPFAPDRHPPRFPGPGRVEVLRRPSSAILRKRQIPLSAGFRWWTLLDSNQ